MVRVFTSNPKVKGSNLMGGQRWLCVVNNGMLIESFLIEFLEWVLRLIMWPTYLPRRGFQPSIGSDMCQ